MDLIERTAGDVGPYGIFVGASIARPVTVDS